MLYKPLKRRNSSAIFISGAIQVTSLCHAITECGGCDYVMHQKKKNAINFIFYFLNLSISSLEINIKYKIGNLLLS